MAVYTSQVVPNTSTAMLHVAFFYNKVEHRC